MVLVLCVGVGGDGVAWVVVLCVWVFDGGVGVRGGLVWWC